MVDVSDTSQTIIRRFREGRHSRIAVKDGEPDNVIGVLHARDFLGTTAQRGGLDVRSQVIDAPVVRDGMGALDVIEALRGSMAHMVLVYDEYGHFEGVITPMDVLEAITGEFAGWDDDEPKIVEREDGSLLVAGWMPADEFADRLGTPLPEDRDYSTAAGLVLDLTGRLPLVGDHVNWQGWRIEVVDLDGRRIDKLLVNRLPR